MKAIRQFLGGALLCVIEVAVGVLLLIDPVNFTTGIIVVCGAVLALWGLVYTVRYFRTEAETAAQSHYLTKGLTLLFFGGFCVLKSSWLIEVIPMMTMVYGIAILLCGIGKIQWAFDLLRAKKEKWYMAGISAVLSLVCSAVILYAPFATTTVLWIFTGSSLICEAFVDVITFLLSGHSREPSQQLTVPETSAEPDFVELEETK